MMKILYEDKNVIVVLKPAGVLSQPSPTQNASGETDMLSLVSEHLGDKPSEISLIHRLDRGTAGIMLFSKQKATAGKLSEAISDKDKCIKEYLAVVSGIPSETEGEMCDYLFKDARSGKSFALSGERKGAKYARLSYNVIGTAEGEKGTLSLVRIRLFTGRTHQIRVQFSSRGMPIVGDGKYGSRERVRGVDTEGTFASPKEAFALFAYHLSVKDAKTVSFDITEVPNSDIYPFSLFREQLNQIRKS